MRKHGTAPISVGRAIERLIVAIGIVLAISAAHMPRAQAQSDDATKILKTMSDYVSGQKNLSLTFDTGTAEPPG